MKFIGIVGPVIGFSGELAVLGIAVEIGVRTGCREDGFDLLFVVPVGDFGKTSEIVFDRKFVDDDELSSLIQKRDFPAKYIVIHKSACIPGGFTIPARNFYKVCGKFDFRKRVFFLPDDESNLIGSTYFKREFQILFEDSGIHSDGEPRKNAVSGFEPNG